MYQFYFIVYLYMKSLYLGMATIALVLIALSISIETSIGKNIKLLNRSRNKNNNSNTPEFTTSVTYSLNPDQLENTEMPERRYGQNNLNKIFLQKYYNSNYPNNVKISNKFYVPN
jgi:hypothetical protein